MRSRIERGIEPSVSGVCAPDASRASASRASAWPASVSAASPPPAELLVFATSPDATCQVAAAIAGLVESGDLVLLTGELGAGKTTFSQGFAAALGVVEAVTSPTFTLIKSYTCGLAAPGGVETLVHADLYRLDRIGEIVDLAIGEMLEERAVALVEWADRASGVLGDAAVEVHMVIGDTDTDRLMHVRPGRSFMDRWDLMCERLEGFRAPVTADHHVPSLLPGELPGGEMRSGSGP